ncbi:hypothetical protein [Kribbella ginsengisoli]|uniref:Uncharacterized protein n=1 Tax=Kribbella ginsengisoli TaxID=363865 RepID=A0ABP6Z8U7_9ACTN
MAKNLPPGHGGYRATPPAAKKKTTGKTVAKKSGESSEWVKRDTGSGQFVPAPPKSSKGGPTSAKK